MKRRTKNRGSGSGTASAVKTEQRIRLSILSSFSCGHLQSVLKFWGERLEVPLDLIIDESCKGPVCGNSEKALLQNNHLNVILLRLEDWLSQKEDFEGPADEVLLEKIDQFQRSIEDRVREEQSPYLILITPGDHKGKVSAGSEQVVIEWMQDWSANKDQIMVHGHEFIEEHYPVRSVIDKEADSGRPPYREEYFSALGTMIIRVLAGIYRKQYKMVVLDCDHTLWKGSCSNGGHKGVMVNRTYKYLQEFMVARKSEGLQLGICSKNAESDVVDVFEHYPDMPLKKTDIIIDRVNWEPKCKNIREMTRELGIERDRVIFIDDNPVECAEVQSNCPEVMALRLPDAEDDIPAFLDHIWAFDHFDLAANPKLSGNKEQTEYEQNGIAGADPASLVEFIVNLDTSVRLLKPRIKDLLKMSQLSLRAVRFNFSGVRREVHQIQGVLNSGHLQARVCMVSDRLDDYGISGMMMFGKSEDRLILDTFIMDWKVMGRGVEHEMLAELGRIAQSEGLHQVEIYFRNAPQNQPAREFLESVAGEYREPDDSGYTFRIPAEFLSRIQYSETPVLPGLKPPAAEPESSNDFFRLSQYQALIAKELNSTKKIHDQVSAYGEEHGESEFAGAGSKLKALITEVSSIWKTILEQDSIEPDDDFFQVGGTSLKGYQIITEVQRRFQVNLDTTLMDDFSSIRKLSRKLYHKLNTEIKGSGSFEEDGGAYSDPGDQREVIII